MAFKNYLTEAILINHPERGIEIRPDGGMGSWTIERLVKDTSDQLNELSKKIKYEDFSGAEYILFKNGAFKAKISALSEYDKFKTKQGKRPIAKGKEINLSESELAENEMRYQALAMAKELHTALAELTFIEMLSVMDPNNPAKKEVQELETMINKLTTDVGEFIQKYIPDVADAETADIDELPPEVEEAPAPKAPKAADDKEKKADQKEKKAEKKEDDKFRKDDKKDQDKEKADLKKEKEKEKAELEKEKEQEKKAKEKEQAELEKEKEQEKKDKEKEQELTKKEKMKVVKAKKKALKESMGMTTFKEFLDEAEKFDLEAWKNSGKKDSKIKPVGTEKTSDNDFDKLSFADKRKLIKSKFNKVSDEMLDDYAKSKWVNLPNDIKRVV